MSTKETILRTEGRTFPGKTYTEVVLTPAYDHAKESLLDPMIAVHKAHLIMLVEQTLLSKEQALKIVEAIQQLDLEAIKKTTYDGHFEDLFFQVEDLIMSSSGEIGGSLHLARSRNDMGVAMYRLTLRQKLQTLMYSLLNFEQILLELASEHVETIMLGYTHTQQAQPTTLAHYLLAVFDSVGRDYTRLKAAYATTNRSPLGAAALTTTGFSIDRNRVAELLGFEGLVENSYDAIGGADYLGESASSVQLTLIGIGRCVQDLLLWSTQEFGALRIADPYVQISSIMPQKRNPVSLEHIRALSSSGIGRATTVLQMLHNTPFGDIVDTEDDLQPHLWSGINLADQIFRLLGVVLGTLEVNQKLLLERAKTSFASVTELADTLVREYQQPFRTAHSIASSVVKIALSADLDATQVTSEMVDVAAEQVIGRPLQLPESLVRQTMDPTYFVEIRKQTGGPAPLEIKRAIGARRKTLSESFIETEQTTAKITDSIAKLDDVFAKWRLT